MRKRGKEAKTPEGLQRVRPVWEHELEHVRATMRKHGDGYEFCLVQSPAGTRGRLWGLYTNMNLTTRLANRLYRHTGPRHPSVARYYREATV